MLNAFQIAILSLVQGLTEFLPISSSAHLILVPYFAHWPDQGILFDVAVHFGTLLAVTLYFRDTLVSIAKNWITSLLTRKSTQESKLGWQLILSTLPAVLVGLFFHDMVANTLRSPLVIGFTTIIFGILLLLSDYNNKKNINNNNKNNNKNDSLLSWKAVLFVGMAQALALIPGTSRSGITMTACLFIGLTRENAARFSFLMSIPIILMATSYEGLRLIKEPIDFSGQELALAVGIAFMSAYFCIHYFLKLIQKIGMLPFTLYRLCLGAGIFLLFI
jgi:undecaprenyl-diphosphatase